MEEAGLSRGLVAAILASEDGWHSVDRPAVLQVTDLRLLCPPARPSAGFRMVLSDGLQSVQGMLPTSMNGLVGDNELRRGTVLRLLEYSSNTWKNVRVFMFLDFDILQTDCMLIEYGEGQLIEADRVRKTIAQIKADNLVCSDDEATQSVVVKATLTFINKENICYAACPLMVDGMQCCIEMSRNEDGWWQCHSCNNTFAACDYMYRGFIQIQDATGSIYASVPQGAGNDIFGCTAKELYLMKHEQEDCTQFDDVIGGVLFHDFLFELKLQTGAIHDETLPKYTVLRAEKVNPSTENCHLLREINKLKESSDCAAACRTSVGSRIGFSYLQDGQRVQNFSHGHGAMNRGGFWDLVSQTGSNTL